MRLRLPLLITNAKKTETKYIASGDNQVPVAKTTDGLHLVGWRCWQGTVDGRMDPQLLLFHPAGRCLEPP